MLLALDYSTPQFIFGATAVFAPTGTLDLNWGGVNIWISLNGVDYSLAGTLTSSSIVGLLTQPLAAFGGANPDNTETLYVSLAASNGALEPSSDALARAGSSLFVVVDTNGFEAIAYTTATLVSPFTYALTGLYRGLYSSLPRAFSAGSQFLFVGTNANVFFGSLPAAYIGQNFFVKPQSFNVLRGAPEDITTVVAYEYFITGPGGALVVTDSVTTSDTYLLAGQFFEILSDIVVGSETNGAGSALFGSIDDTVTSSESVALPDTYFSLTDFGTSSEDMTYSV
jgi:hypothetical protein